VKLEHSVTIDRPVEEVFAFVSDPTNDDQFVAARISTKKTTSGPLGPGSRFDATGKFLGRRIDSSMEVSEYQPNRKICSRSLKAPVQFTDCRVVEADGNGTRLTITLESEATGGLFKLADPVVSRLAKRQLEVDVNTLKELLEASVGVAS
jgi:uncharacterized protein YndB with AHSA1/START domain